MLRKIQTKLEYKILLLITAVLIAGFGSYVVHRIQSESRALLEEHGRTVRLFSETIVAGIRNVMMTGKAPLTHEFLNDARRNLAFGSLTIYDRFGREVFLREGEGVVYDVDNPLVRAALASGSAQSAMMKEGAGEVFTRFEPLENRPECWRCHERDHTLRGVLQLALKPGLTATMTSGQAMRRMAGAMGDVLATAFRTIMLGGQGEQMDTLIAKAQEIPAVVRVQVYSKDAYVAFGEETEDGTEETVAEIIEAQEKGHRFEERGGKLRLFLPLENQERCQVCHGAKFPMRGVMVIDFEKELLRRSVADPSTVFAAALQKATFEGFRSIMLVGRANSVRYFLDELRRNDAVHSVHVFDREGNERFLNPPPRTRAEVGTIVEEKGLRTLEFSESQEGEEFKVRLVPILNEVRCYTCHGKNHDVRAVVEVAASMKTINAEVARLKWVSGAAALVTILLVWLVLRIFMNTVVVKPVQIIEGVASKVGGGDFTVQAHVASKDEIGSLARQINDMVQGLRERFHLEKFVSRQTVDAVRRADQSGIRLGGERKVATVFFSDIRGFTAYSERVEPERVVSMLNRCLARQSAIVRSHGGDIDKFVGDELVAVYEGTDMADRAVRAAIEILRQLETETGEEKDVLNIGIGINTGEMVMGAMGSPDRMDYTVIGDNVNLGARLCSAAGPGQILISGATVEHLREPEKFRLLQLEPIIVKGKEKPLRVYEVQWRL